MAIQKRLEESSDLPSTKLRLYRNDSVEFEDAPPLLEEISPLRITLGDFVYPDVLARQVCFWAGLVMSCIGAIEYIFPESAIPAAGTYHSHFYLFSGIALVLPAFTFPPGFLKKVSFLFGLAFVVLGSIGFLVGSPFGGERFQASLFPGNLEFGTRDHILQVIIGVSLIFGGRFQRKLSETEKLNITMK